MPKSSTEIVTPSPFNVRSRPSVASSINADSVSSSSTDAGEATPLAVGGLVVDPVRRSVELDGALIRLTRREFDLLAYLAARPGQVVSRRELLTEVWRQAYGQDQTIDVHVSLLRRKLGESAHAPRYLHTVRGVGVRLNPPE